MAKRLVLILCIFFAVSIVAGCGHSLKFWKKKKKEVEVVNKKLPPFEDLFKRTVEMYNSRQYKDAINSLLFLRENYPQKMEYQSRITLYLADSHFHQKEYPEAIANYEEFIKLYPTSPDVPYAYFQIGMSNYSQRRTYDRDATFVRKALKSFKKVLKVAPPGVLTNESVRMIAFCRRELSRHDLFIADFYLRTHHYKSAIMRYKGVIDSYPNLKIYDRSHLGIAKAYIKLKEKDRAYRHLSYVARNYPTSYYGKEAWKILQKKFKVVSLNQLPVVKLPIKEPVIQPAHKAVEGGGSKTGVKGAKAEKVNPKAPKKLAEVVTKKPEQEPKAHVYFPKIKREHEKPVVYSPPVKEAVKTASVPKVAKRAVSHGKLEAKVGEKREMGPKEKEPQAAENAEKAPIKKASLASTNVKKMVKTDTLPPKEGKESSSGLVGALDTRQPIHIISDHMEAKQGSNSVRFYGNVDAKQRDVTLRCDDLTAFYTNGGNAIDKIIARGRVSITQKNKKVACGKAIFYNAERQIVLEDSPTAWDGANKISGSRMILLLEKNEIQVLGSEEKPTELVIYPEK